MNDQAIMENLLLTTKGVCDLSDSLCMQDDIYKQMTAKGWYPSQEADAQQIEQVRQKYAQMN